MSTVASPVYCTVGLSLSRTTWASHVRGYDYTVTNTWTIAIQAAAIALCSYQYLHAYSWETSGSCTNYTCQEHVR